MATAIVRAVHNYDKFSILVQVSKGLGAAMNGLDVSLIPEGEILQSRGW